MNLRRFTNIQVSLLEMIMVICSWGPTKEPVLKAIELLLSACECEWV